MNLEQGAQVWPMIICILLLKGKLEKIFSEKEICWGSEDLASYGEIFILQNHAG